MSNPGAAVTTTSTYVGGGEDVRIGNDSSSTIGFYGAAGVARQTTPVAVVTTAPTLSAYGFTYAQAAAMITAVNAIIAAGVNLNVWA